MRTADLAGLCLVILTVGGGGWLLWSCEKVGHEQEEMGKKALTDAVFAAGVCHGRGGVVVEDGGCGFQCRIEPLKEAP
jgi:hypothetical protein